MSTSKSHKTEIIVAIIGVIGVLGAAVIANLDRFFGMAPREPTSFSTPANSNTAPRDALREAEKLTAAWFSAWKKQDVEALVSAASPPFFFDNEILLSISDIRAKYGQIFSSRRPRDESLTIHQMKVGLVSEFKKQGLVSSSRDRVLSNMRINDDDIAVILVLSTESLKNEGIIFFFRTSGSKLEMAGWWD